MKPAALRAATRRGSSITIRRPSSHGASSSASGTAVVLPAPGGASSTRRGCAARLRPISGSSGAMGSSGADTRTGYVAPARGRRARGAAAAPPIMRAPRSAAAMPPGPGAARGSARTAGHLLLLLRIPGEASVQLIAIGLNLTHDSFDHDRDAVWQRAREAGVARAILTGASREHSPKALELARTRPGEWFATAGVHPHHASEYTAECDAELRALHAHPEVVAVGECGLDYFRDFSPRPAQRRAF